MINPLSRFFDIRHGEARRIGIMVSLLFFLIAANSVIKVVRDSLFLSRFPISYLAYMYLAAAVIAGIAISVYKRCTTRVSLYRLALGLNAFIISNVIVFGLLIAFFDFGWAIQVFYIWSAIITVLTVAEFWTLAGLVFTPRQAKRLFGIFSAGGSLGALFGALGSGWAVNLFMGTGQLFWFIGALFAGALGVIWLARSDLSEIQTLAPTEIPESGEAGSSQQISVFSAIRVSGYLQLIAGTIFVSVAVSTIIDFEFKAAAKMAYPSEDALTAFFVSYYAWVAIITFIIQVVLTGRLLTGLGLIPSLFLLPVSLTAGSLVILIWPGLFSSTMTRVTDAVLRPSVNQSSMEILYLPLPANLKKHIQTFLDVVLQRLGDGVAGLIVLFYALFIMQYQPATLAFFSLGLIVIWSVLIFLLRGGYRAALRTGLEAQTIAWQAEEINYADKQTIEAVLQNLRKDDERALLFGLDLAEKLDPKVIVPRFPLSLLQHSSPAVRSRSLKLFAASTDPKRLQEIVRLLEDENGEVKAEAINVVCAIRKEDAIPLMRPYLEGPDPRVQRSAIECLLHHGDPEIREVALTSLRKMVGNPQTDGTAGRIEAARLMGEVNEPEFFEYLRKLIHEDSSFAVIREALAAAGKRKDPALLKDIILRLGCPKTMGWAHQALIQYGEIAVQTLQEALLDSNISRDVRLNIAPTLSKIGSPYAMAALLSGLTQGDGSLRYKIILALQELVRRLPDLLTDRRVVEIAIVVEARRYYRRFLTLFALFGDDHDRSMHNGWLLHQALVENMEREKERVLRLLSLIYPPEDIGSASAALHGNSPAKRDQAIEFLDNLLTGDVKRHVFPLFDDAPASERFERFLALLGLTNFDGKTAFQELLKHDDVWLKAATFWEIGLRGLRDFYGELRQSLNSKEPVLKETAQLVLSRI